MAFGIDYKEIPPKTTAYNDYAYTLLSVLVPVPCKIKQATLTASSGSAGSFYGVMFVLRDPELDIQEYEAYLKSGWFWNGSASNWRLLKWDGDLLVDADNAHNIAVQALVYNRTGITGKRARLTAVWEEVK